MSVRGQIKNGVVVLDDGTVLPEGAIVQVQLEPPAIAEKPADTLGPTLYETLKPFIGCLNDMPPDMSVNLDHYLYGAPKQVE